MIHQAIPRLIGMVHLRALPGSPSFDGSFDHVVESAVADAVTLAESGFDGIGIENFFDVPFFPDDVPAVTVAAMTAAVDAVSRSVDVPLMVNVLRNDGLSALAIAAVTGASFVRVNVLSGSMWTDQGLVHGRAAEIVRRRADLAPSVGILADVFVKHATPPPGADLVQSSLDLVERAGADAVIVSGAGTGAAADLDHVDVVRNAIGHTPLIIGSGVTADTVGTYLSIADGVVVGTALKPDGDTSLPIDQELALAFVTSTGG